MPLSSPTRLASLGGAPTLRYSGCLKIIGLPLALPRQPGSCSCTVRLSDFDAGPEDRLAGGWMYGARALELRRSGMTVTEIAGRLG